jgi:hypothetical protein
MQVTKCDICKKAIKDSSNNVHVAVGSSMFSNYHEICASCGKSVLKFLKSKKLVEDKKDGKK